MEESDGRRWVDFEVSDRREKPFVRLLERLPDAHIYETDAYDVHRWLPSNRHGVGKYGAVNRNEGLHSVPRGKLSWLVRSR